jgi:hypothetical protein
MSIVKSIKGMRKQGLTRYMIESEIEKVKDPQEKAIYIKLYNEKLKSLGINEQYQFIPFERETNE